MKKQNVQMLIIALLLLTHWANFNCVDLCHDAAKHASMMALAAPSVLTTQQ